MVFANYYMKLSQPIFLKYVFILAQSQPHVSNRQVSYKKKLLLVLKRYNRQRNVDIICLSENRTPTQ